VTERRATREAYGPTLVELVREGVDVVVVEADLSKSTTTAKFAAAYPERFFNTGVAEQNMIGTAAGLAVTCWPQHLHDPARSPPAAAAMSAAVKP